MKRKQEAMTLKISAFSHRGFCKQGIRKELYIIKRFFCSWLHSCWTASRAKIAL